MNTIPANMNGKRTEIAPPPHTKAKLTVTPTERSPSVARMKNWNKPVIQTEIRNSSIAMPKMPIVMNVTPTARLGGSPNTRLTPLLVAMNKPCEPKSMPPSAITPAQTRC